MPARRILGIAVRLLLALLAVAIASAIFAAIVYERPAPSNLPCRGCAGDASSIAVNGFDLYVRELGAENGGAPMVVLHGGPDHSSDGFQDSLDFLAAEYRVLYYDQRGSGHSQSLPDPALYTIDQLVEELEALRREVLGANRIILRAHSAGGSIAQRYPLAHGDRVEKMILVSSTPINNGVAVPALWDALGPALFVLGAGIPPADPAEANAWFAQVLVETSAPRLYDPANRPLLENSGPVSFVTWREVSRSLKGDDFREDLAGLEVDTLVVFGEADGGTTGPAAAAALCGLLPRCRLESFERSGRWPFFEEPERFAEVLRSFLVAP